MHDPFPATLAAARSRVAAVRPAAYAATRNHLDGAVSGLSPYLTHGFVTLREVLSGVASRHRLDARHRFVQELGWRAYFRHVWAHRGSGILASLHDGVLPEAAYSRELPSDIREARTGVPVIDQAIRTLYATGMLHNHARLWLASYVVHLRKLHWRAGADWLCGHLLDGDLASNHLSWQWVAGTGSHRPYLFNAGNVARHAPAAWHSAATVIDTGYDALEAMARSPSAVRVEGPGCGIDEPAQLGEPPGWLGAQPPDASQLRGCDVWLVHPWSLGELPEDLPRGTRVIGVLCTDFHRAWPWSERRWRFVGARMNELTSLRWTGDARAIGEALASARSVRCTAEPHLDPWLGRWADTVEPPGLFPTVARRCDSFSQWWTRAMRGVRSVDELLGETPHTPDLFA